MRHMYKIVIVLVLVSASYMIGYKIAGSKQNSNSTYAKSFEDGWKTGYHDGITERTKNQPQSSR